MAVGIRKSLSSASYGVMTFLNEVVQRFPAAISLAPGRPSARFCNAEGAFDDAERWVAHRAAATGLARDRIWSDLGQYGSTPGFILDLICGHLAADLGIHVDESAVVVTTGCQEAMLISVLTLLEPSTDTLLVSDPSYIGITGIASVLGVPVQPVPTGPDGLRAADVEAAAIAVLRTGRRPRALYDVPDFNNPLGTRLPLDARHALLDVARRFDMTILEDNPYGAFAYDEAALPTLKALDSSQTVVYLGSFAKTLFPGLRIGYVVADAPMPDGTGPVALALTAMKSLTTLNTSSITQAMTGGALLRHGGSLAPIVEAKSPHYLANRDRMLAALDRELGQDPGGPLAQWNRPAGGFFLVVSLPFAFGGAQLERCAADYGVIVSPMSHFSIAAGREHQIRLSFSYAEGDEIDEGIRRLARFIRDEASAAVAPSGQATPAALAARI